MKIILASMIFLFPALSFAFQFQMAGLNSCALARPSCLAHYNAGCRTDGNYSLRVSGNLVSAFCDMTTDGGGWTRINANLTSQALAWSLSAGTNGIVTSAPTTFGANDILSLTNIGNSCTGSSVGNPAVMATVPSVSLAPPPFAFTNIREIFTRTTVMQCANFISIPAAQLVYGSTGTWTAPSFTSLAFSARAYWNGTTWVSWNASCTWGDGVWANSTSNYSISTPTVLPTTWKFTQAATSATNLYAFSSRCSAYTPDHTPYTMQVYFR